MSEIICLLDRFYPQIKSCFFHKDNYTIWWFFIRYETPELFLYCHYYHQYYIESTQLQMFRRIAQHKGVSFRINRPLTKLDFSPIREHCDTLNHPFKIDRFSKVDCCLINCDLKLLESIIIYNDKLALNRNKLASHYKFCNSNYFTKHSYHCIQS